MSDLLRDLYACAEAPEGWQAVLDQLCGRMGVRSAVLQVFDRDGRGLVPVWQARDSYSFAHRERHDLILNNGDNPRLRVFAPRPALPGRSVVRDEDVFAPESEALVELRLRLAAIELGHNATGFADLPEQRRVALIVHRAAGDPRPLGVADEALISSLMPHVQQCMRLMVRLNAIHQQADLLIAASTTLGAGTLFCDPDGVISWANDAARSIIDSSCYLRAGGGRLRALRPADRAALAGLLSDAAGASVGAGAPVQLVLGSGDGAEMVQILAVGAPPASPGTMGLSPSGVLLLLRQPGKPPRVSPESVAQLFGLSTAEARLTAALCDGLSLADYAAIKGISVGTARIQLKRALAKSQSHRQSELVRKVCAALSWTQSAKASGIGAAFPPARLQ